MRFYADYHTHTHFSHGKGSISENVSVAHKKGLSTIGISDHGPANLFIGTKLDDFKKMRDQIETLKIQYEDMEILLGCEANLMSTEGDIDIPEHILDELDYCMVGFHPMVWPHSLKDMMALTWTNMASRFSGFLQDKIIQQNTSALIKAIQRHDIKIITHPGLRLPIDTGRLACMASKVGTVLEINAGHGYMTTEYVKIAKEQGAKFAIGSDAHRPEDVGNFDKGIKIAKAAGLSSKDIINAVVET